VRTGVACITCMGARARDTHVPQHCGEHAARAPALQSCTSISPAASVAKSAGAHVPLELRAQRRRIAKRAPLLPGETKRAQSTGQLFALRRRAWVAQGAGSMARCATKRLRRVLAPAAAAAARAAAPRRSWRASAVGLVGCGTRCAALAVVAALVLLTAVHAWALWDACASGPSSSLSEASSCASAQLDVAMGAAAAYSWAPGSTWRRTRAAGAAALCVHPYAGARGSESRLVGSSLTRAWFARRGFVLAWDDARLCGPGMARTCAPLELAAALTRARGRRRRASSGRV
jgi:hypothetical protein